MSTPIPETIREAIAATRDAEAKRRQDLSRCAGTFATRALITSAIITPATWMGLVWGLVQWHDQSATVAHVVWVGLAAMLAPMTLMLALSCLDRREYRRRHDELLTAMEVLSARITSGTEAVDRTVEHLASALPGGGRVSQIR